jgi:tRNA pseudouridine38-40 synthase
MSRYFIEVAYKGTSFKGFQVQDNANTIQGEINKALHVLLKEEIETTTSSRTDAGVHAFQNFLHFDTAKELTARMHYNMNAILPNDIVLQALYRVGDQCHSRFDALSREYDYFIIQKKNPFLRDTSYFYPLPVDIGLMNEAAAMLLQTTDFTSFAKRHSDVNNFNCDLKSAKWTVNQQQQIVFHVESNRFLRGMVRGLVATQLLVGRKKISLSEFEQILFSHDCTHADFSAPGHGLFLSKVNYPSELTAFPLL